jgi:hypothetical protein
VHRDQPAAVAAERKAHARGDLGRPGGQQREGSWLSMRAIIPPPAGPAILY